MSTQIKRIATRNDYDRLPEGAHFQLISGELIPFPARTPAHQRVLQRMAQAFSEHVERHGLGQIFMGPIDVVLGEIDVYQPDIVYVSRDRAGIVGDKRLEQSPDMIVEVLSESTAYWDLWVKGMMYAKGGVREFWIADPRSQIIEVRMNLDSEWRIAARAQGCGTLESTALPGCVIEAGHIFQRRR